MAILMLPNDIISEVQALKVGGLDTNKLIYTIRIKVFSVLNDDGAVSTENMGYTRLCSVNMSKNRRYCVETLKNMFDKARIRINLNLLGVLVSDLEDDDYEGKCNCIVGSSDNPLFPLLSLVAEASQENKNDENHYKCKHGDFPDIA
ncbi:uncharacterized protein LOC112681334 [Sipha flava]|uniref:Uncharacterized protein LOC112681334 n=1 Tax=Sipha flava TaxID=143950 RepID=A0A8B8F9U1_9HEMI|nr:uncharacterized protein LOC112681334 [Sipha flava]